MNRSLMKAAQIFDTLMAENNPVGVNEFARKLDMPKSTVSRFLSTMEALGFVRREPGSGKFRLGLKLFELGCRAIEDMDLREIAVPHMAKLRDAINENVLLTVLEGDRITYLENDGKYASGGHPNERRGNGSCVLRLQWQGDAGVSSRTCGACSGV